MGFHPEPIRRVPLSHPTNEALLHLYRLPNDRLHGLPARLVLQGVEQLAREVAVQPLVATDHLVAEGQAGHEAAFLEPENRAETSGKENSLRGVRGGEGTRAAQKRRWVYFIKSKGGECFKRGHAHEVSADRVNRQHSVMASTLVYGCGGVICTSRMEIIVSPCLTYSVDITARQASYYQARVGNQALLEAVSLQYSSRSVRSTYSTHSPWNS